MTAIYNYLASKIELPYEKKYSQKSLLTSVCIIEGCFIIAKIRAWFMITNLKIRSNYNVHQITKLDWLYLHNPAANSPTNYSHNYTVPSVLEPKRRRSRPKFKAFQVYSKPFQVLFQVCSKWEENYTKTTPKLHLIDQTIN